MDLDELKELLHILDERVIIEFELEVKAFPGGRHDDQVDSMSQFLGWASKQGTCSAGFILVPKRSGRLDSYSDW